MNTELTPGLAASFARVTLDHVTREYPHKADHVMTSDADVYIPRKVHPVFYGSFDWHSCVHGYWLLARIRRRFPAMKEAVEIEQLFRSALTPEKLEVEREYLTRESARGFERPYGWAWLLMLSAELELAELPQAKDIAPLARAFSERLRQHLPLMSYPVRAGTHANTAFAMILAHRYAIVMGDHSLLSLICSRLIDWFQENHPAQAVEPSGEDFLSPMLMEAIAMRRALRAQEFRQWLDAFLPRLEQGQPSELFVPPVVTDITDGKIGHLNGLNLTRAWAFGELAEACEKGSALREKLSLAAEEHLLAGMSGLRGDYMGEHWLATFALLALDAVA